VKRPIVALILLSLQACALHPPRVDDCCFVNNRPETGFEKTEQATGGFLAVTGILAFLSNFIARGFIPNRDLDLNNKILTAAIGSATFGVFLAWDGSGAFQALGTCRKKPSCMDFHGISDWNNLRQTRLNKHDF
jgi:hypothetical protein